MLAIFRFPDLVDAARGGERGLLDQFDAVCSDAGAFGLTDVPLDPDLLARVHGATLDLFQLPQQVKSRLRSSDGDQFVGWKGQADNRNEFGFPDHKEMFHIGPRVDPALRGPDGNGRLPAPAPEVEEARCSLWPAELPSLSRSWHAYYRAMQGLTSQLGEVMAAALGVPLQRWRELITDNWSDLAANYYPPASRSASPTPAVRNALHSDLTLFTVLFQDAGGGGGLRMQARDGAWLDVPPVEGQFLVNIGELLTYLTSDRWWAVPHEVTPADLSVSGSDTVRISIPFFHRPNDSHVVTPFASVETPTSLNVGDWVRDRKLQAQGT